MEDHLADNGVFKARIFIQHLRDRNQRLQLCGVNSHHKNAIVERSIQTVSTISRDMMMNSSLRWKDVIEGSLWPTNISYLTHIHNQSTNNKAINPADLVTGATIPRHKLKDLHIFGCPVYILDSLFKAWNKLPCYQPRYRRGLL